jgi:hypothetical protein
VYHPAVLRIAIACAVLAGSAVAAAQVPDPAGPTPGDPARPPDTGAQDPTTTPPRSAEPPVPVAPAPPAPAVPRQAESADTAQRDRGLAEEKCASRDPGCDWIATLSSLERATVLRALTARGYALDPAPWGKVIGAVRVYNEDVFAEGWWLLRFFNNFHVTTKESTIRTDAVISAGERWDQARVEETARKLRDPLWTSIVAVLPVAAAQPGTVDALIVTRDIWSLRFNTTYTFQQGKLTDLVTSLSENNLAGKRDVFALAVTMDQGAFAAGPLFIDKNLVGEHLDLRAQVSEIVNRDALLDRGAFHAEGSQSTISLTRPLWSLASEWAAGVSFTHRFAIDRQFRGTGLRTFTYTDPDTMESTTFDNQYKMRRWGVRASVTRQWGDAVKSQLSFGHSVDSQRPVPLDDAGGSPEALAAFVARVLPRSEVTSVPFVEYAMFTPRYSTLRNVATFALAEDLRTGPDLDVSLGFGLEVLGSDHNFERLSATAGWTLPWARDGFWRAATSFSTRRQDGDWVDNTVSGSLRAAAPPVHGVRLLAQTSLSSRFGQNPSNGFYAIGSDSGLRGFAINEFTGQRYFNLQAEARTLPYPVWVLRLGAVAFYDLGGAEVSLTQMALHQDAGVGLRILIPQTSAQLLKFDVAIPFDGENRGAPRFLAGFGSEF